MSADEARRPRDGSRSAPASEGDLADLPEWLHAVRDGLDQITSQLLSPRMPSPPDDARASSVLLLFGEGEAGPDVLLTERAHTLRSHPGQLAFPGGRKDPEDPDLVATALREAQEEVGLEPDGVEVIGSLPRLWIPPSNSAVTTVVAWWRTPSPVTVVDEAEVASVLRVPVDHLLDAENRFTVRHPASGYLSPAFDVGGGLVLWGFTAGIVSRLFEHIGWEREWDPDRIEPVPIPGILREPPEPGGR